MFALRTPVGASSNYAKIAYTSPLLFGAQIALSFTPSEGKQFPFLNAGPHVPGRQVEFWEAAVRYEEELGPVTLAGYGAVSESRAEHKRPGQEGHQRLGHRAKGRLSAGRGNQPVTGRAPIAKATPMDSTSTRLGKRAPRA
jgi:hypothetical protein